MGKECATRLLIGLDVLVDTFMTEAHLLFCGEPAGDLLRTSVLTHTNLNERPRQRLNACGDVRLFARGSELVGLLRPTGALTMIAAHLARDGTGMHTQIGGNLLLCVLLY